MVFLTAVNFMREITKFGRPGQGIDKFWRVQQYLRFAWVWRCRYTILVVKFSLGCGYTSGPAPFTPRRKSYRHRCCCSSHTAHSCIDFLRSVNIMVMSSLNISCTLHYVPRTAYPRIGIFSGENLCVLFIKSKSRKKWQQLYFAHAHTCAYLCDVINAEIKL